MSPLGAVLVRRMPDGEIRTGIPFHGRGTVKVGGVLWQYVRSNAAVLAAESLPQFKGAIGHYDPPAARVTAEYRDGKTVYLGVAGHTTTEASGERDAVVTEEQATSEAAWMALVGELQARRGRR